MEELELDGTGLTVTALARAARGGLRLRLAPDGLERMRRSRALVEEAIAQHIPVYGVTTGLGARAGEALDAETLAGFSVQTLRGRAHAAGERMPAAQVRALLLARLNTFLTGHSGARPEVATHLAGVLNAGLVPVVGSLGSIGGGDLVLNASAALPLIGEGRLAGPDGAEGPAADMLRAAGLAPLDLAPRDGLALANHTGFSAGAGALALTGMAQGFAAAQAGAALTMEGFRANLTPLDPAALRVKPLPGQARAAAGLERVLAGSALWQPGAARRLQDPLSLRNAVQIHGGAAAALDQATQLAGIELNSAGDNPVALAESGRMVSCGAYHTTELGLALEGVARAWQHLAMAQVARIARMMEPGLTGLPLFLACSGSGSNGFAPVLKLVEDLAAEITRAAAPLPVWPSINARGVEDCLTPAPAAARALDRIAGLARHLTAVEMLVAAQAIDLRGSAPDLGPPLSALHARIRRLAPALGPDRPLAADIDALAAALPDMALDASP